MLLHRWFVAFALQGLVLAQTIPGAWVQAAAPGGPTASQCSRMTFDSLRNESVLLNFDGFVNQVFTWDGATWTPRGATPFWGHQRGMVYDPVRDRVVVTTNSDQVWEWDRNIWQMRATTPTARSLVWHGGQQKVLALDAAGLWHWNGNAFALQPGSAPPVVSVPYFAASLAYDVARGILVATYPNYRMLEWNGTAWSSSGSNTHPNMLYAPPLGGVIGFYDGPDTLFWNPAQQRWDPLPVGGAPSPIYRSQSDGLLSMAFDSQRGRVVLFADGPIGVSTWEYDGSAVYQPRTWTVGSAWWIQDLQSAIAYAAAQDTVVMPAGAGALPYSGTITKGVHVEAPTGVQIGGEWIVRPAGGLPFSLSGGVIGKLLVQTTGEFELRDCQVSCDAVIEAGFTRLADCTLGLTGSCSVPLAPGVRIRGPAIVDRCTLTGTGGWQSWVGTFPAQAGILCDTADPLWVTGSTINGGRGGSWSGWGSGPAPAIALQPGGSAVVAGATLLSGDGSPFGIEGTSDTLWGGSTLPGQFTLAPFRVLSAPRTATLGGALTVTASALPASTVFLFFGTTRQAVTVPGFALPLQLDPVAAVPVGLLSVASPTFAMVVPNVAALRGLSTYWQGLDVAATLQVTNHCHVRLL